MPFANTRVFVTGVAVIRVKGGGRRILSKYAGETYVKVPFDFNYLISTFRSKGFVYYQQIMVLFKIKRLLF